MGLVSMLVVHTLKGSMIRYHSIAGTPPNVLREHRVALVQRLSVFASVREYAVVSAMDVEGSHYIDLYRTARRGLDGSTQGKMYQYRYGCTGTNITYLHSPCSGVYTSCTDM